MLRHSLTIDIKQLQLPPLFLHGWYIHLDFITKIAFYIPHNRLYGIKDDKKPHSSVFSTWMITPKITLTKKVRQRPKQASTSTESTQGQQMALLLWSTFSIASDYHIICCWKMSTSWYNAQWFVIWTTKKNNIKSGKVKFITALST